MTFLFTGGLFATIFKNNYLRDLASILKILEFIILPIVVIKTSPPLRQYTFSKKNGESTESNTPFFQVKKIFKATFQRP